MYLFRPKIQIKIIGVLRNVLSSIMFQVDRLFLNTVIFSHTQKKTKYIKGGRGGGLENGDIALWSRNNNLPN